MHSKSIDSDEDKCCARNIGHRGDCGDGTRAREHSTICLSCMRTVVTNHVKQTKAFITVACHRCS